MNLVISAGLSEPPTETLSLRYITMVSHDNLKLDCLFETPQELKDSYYKYLQIRGLLDYVEQLVIPQEKIEGIRLDTELKYPFTIRVKTITVDNLFNVLGQIKSLQDLGKNVFK